MDFIPTPIIDLYNNGMRFYERVLRGMEREEAAQRTTEIIELGRKSYQQGQAFLDQRLTELDLPSAHESLPGLCARLKDNCVER